MCKKREAYLAWIPVFTGMTFRFTIDYCDMAFVKGCQVGRERMVVGDFGRRGVVRDTYLNCL